MAFSGFAQPGKGEPRPPDQGASSSSWFGDRFAGLGAALGLVEQAPAQASTSASAPRGGANFGSLGGMRAGLASSLQPLLGGNSATPGQLKKLTTHERMERYIEAAADLSDERAPQFAVVLRTLKPLFGVLLNVTIVLFTGYARIYAWLYQLYLGLPLNELQMVIGLLLCFFGGTYVALIAAFEAFRTMGGEVLCAHVAFCIEQAKVVLDASRKDDLLDVNKDGIADVDQIPANELTQRKLKVAMVSVTQPERLQLAVGALWAACLAVLATLKLQFAQTTAYAVAIAEMVKFPIIRLTAPSLTWGLGHDLTHWVEPIIDSSLKVTCILLVWYLEKIRAAFYSGLRGGKLFAEAAIELAANRGWMDRLPDFVAKKPFNAEESYIDEALAFSLGAIGFYWQVSHLFFLPFPIDWLLWPVTLAEYFLEVQISWN